MTHGKGEGEVLRGIVPSGTTISIDDGKSFFFIILSPSKSDSIDEVY